MQGLHPTPSACLILVYPGDALPTEYSGRHYALLPQGTWVGTYAENHIHLNLPQVESRQVHIQYEEDGFWYLSNTLRERSSRIYVNAIVSNEHILEDGDLIQMGTAVFKFWLGSSIDATLFENLNKQVQDEKQRAETDFLTQIPNKEMILKSIGSEISWSRRRQRPLCLMICDVDHFRSINETYAHPGGDQILANLAKRIYEKKRLEDTMGRYGGEEFIMLLRDTPLDEAFVIAERIRTLVVTHPFFVEGHSLPISVTISIGVSLLTKDMDPVGDELLIKADQNLYQAKKRGRNQVVIDDPNIAGILA